VYQTLVGAHPLTLDRLWPVLEKSLRESKRHTSWVRVDEQYERATKRFVAAILDDDSFRSELDDLVAIMRDAGFVNALTQTALRTLTPGVPDIYQGCELWDSSLVDPDNRRPVDYDRRRTDLDAIRGTTMAELWHTRRDSGLPKLALLRECLALRGRRPSAFGRDGGYEAVEVHGPDAARVIAFARGSEVIALVPRFSAKGVPDAAVHLPPGRWRNVLTGGVHDGTVSFGEVCGDAPLAVLEVDLDPVG
jgi:(1->4)-alpha-D-glucan 1-alpha-D-glucosylmutase